jgi:hypothetical protein
MRIGTVVFALLLVHQFANPVFLVVLEAAFVLVASGVHILPFALPNAVEVLPVILLAIPVDCVPSACVIA